MIMHNCKAFFKVNNVNVRQSDASIAEGDGISEKMLAPRLGCMKAWVPTLVFEGNMGGGTRRGRSAKQCALISFGLVEIQNTQHHVAPHPTLKRDARSATGVCMMCMTEWSPTLVFERNMGA